MDTEWKALGLVLALRSNLNQWKHMITFLLYNKTGGKAGEGGNRVREQRQLGWTEGLRGLLVTGKGS